jgi:hypothetical protein
MANYLVVVTLRYTQGMYVYIYMYDVRLEKSIALNHLSLKLCKNVKM